MLVSTHGIIAQSESGTPSFSNTKSILLDGVDDFVDCGNPTSLQITGAMTLSAWVKISSATGNVSPIILKDNISLRCFQLLGKIASTSKPRFNIFSSNSVFSVDATTNISDDNWHNVVAVFKPSTSLKIYIDGTLEGTNTTSIPVTIDNDAVNFEIGRLTNSGSTLFAFLGNIDEVAVFNSELSASDVNTIYGGGTPSDISSISGLVSWWRFEGTGTTATDSGSGGNNGTLTNGVTRSADVP